jgi:hypothetical protein
LFKFWLYRDLAEDSRLMEYIGYLHQTRQFATMVRNGLRLMWTLGQGDLSVLFELFPILQAQFKPNNDDLLEQFRQMLLQHQPVVSAQPIVALPHSTPRPILSDDEQDTVVIKKDASVGSNTTLNFLKNAFGLRNEGLPEAIDESYEDGPLSEPEPRPVRTLDNDEDYVPALEPSAMVMKKMV